MLRTPSGVEEDITLALGYSGDETPPLDAIENLATELDAQHGLVTLLTALCVARRDLTVPARLEHPPIPVTFTLGHDEAERIGPARAEHPPQGAAVRLGRTARTALHYTLGDGTDPQAWTTFQRLTRHLKRE